MLERNFRYKINFDRGKIFFFINTKVLCHDKPISFLLLRFKLYCLSDIEIKFIDFQSYFWEYKL